MFTLPLTLVIVLVAPWYIKSLQALICTLRARNIEVIPYLSVSLRVCTLKLLTVQLFPRGEKQPSF